MPDFVYADEVDDIFDMGDDRIGHTELVYDPIEKINREVFRFNVEFDKRFLGPLTHIYSAHSSKNAVPWIVVVLRNFSSNLDEISNSLAFMLEGKWRSSVESLLRFYINSFVGFLGFIDVAEGLGLHKHEKELEVFFAKTGMVQGPYLVLPFWGSTSMRSIFVSMAKYPLNPLAYFVDPSAMVWVSAINKFLNRLDYPITHFDDSIDLDAYVAWRSSYYQNIGFMVHDDAEYD